MPGPPPVHRDVPRLKLAAGHRAMHERSVRGGPRPETAHLGDVCARSCRLSLLPSTSHPIFHFECTNNQMDVGMREELRGMGETVRRRRTELGLRQDDLARLAGCSARFVHTVEQGKPSLRLDKLLDVLEVLGLGLSVVPGPGDLAEGPQVSAAADRR